MPAAIIAADERRAVIWRNGPWQGQSERLCAFLYDSIEEILTFYRLPLARRKYMKSSDALL